MVEDKEIKLENIADYLIERGIKTQYLHSEVKTMPVFVSLATRLLMEVTFC